MSKVEEIEINTSKSIGQMSINVRLMVKFYTCTMYRMVHKNYY